MPPNVEHALADSIFHRKDPAEADAVFQRLGVKPKSEFKEFYRRYEGAFTSEVSGFELCDLAGPNEFSIESLTRQCREHHSFPDRYLALTDLCGGAILVYDCESDAVFNVDFEGGSDQLRAGKLAPHWPSFDDFLEEYFTPPSDDDEMSEEYPIPQPHW